MEIAIISDVHDNLINLDKVLYYLKQNKVKNLIFCGDLTSDETLKWILENYDHRIDIVKGNADNYILDNISNNILYKKVNYFELSAVIKFDKVSIGFSHFPQIARNMIENKNLSYVFYGHTHKPWIEKMGNVILANPGNVAGINYLATFAILDIKNTTLKLIKIDDIK
jgi:hypothetical protein